MQEIFVRGSNIHSPLGFNTADNFSRLISGDSGVQEHSEKNIDSGRIWASLFSPEQTQLLKDKTSVVNQHSVFERLMIASANEALESSGIDAGNHRTIFICSSTKGSISEINSGQTAGHNISHLELYSSANKLTSFFQNPNEPIVISNACISGLAAIIVAERMLKSGEYDHAVVVGADTIGSFVYSGFNSFMALSPGKCKPFSSDRDGINLGEAAATIILSITREENNLATDIRVGTGSMSNDANHISGPSRTGEELGLSIKKSLASNRLVADDIGFISAHGTATPYNDEMEAKAINYAGLAKIPVNSLKGYFGHTLGAAGILESIISIESMKRGIVLASAGYSEDGLQPEVNVCRNKMDKNYNHCLKTASGFGGCNATIIFSKNYLT